MTSDIPVTAAEKRHPRLWLSLKIILPIVALVAGIAALITLVETAPRAGRQPPPRSARPVDVALVERTHTQAVLSAMGLVHPAREVVLHPQVGGRITFVSPDLIPGGVKNEGEELFLIEGVDYELALRRAESDHATAQGEYDQEMGQQAVARHEFTLMGSQDLAPEERALILREPQLQKAKAKVDSTLAALDQARLNLERTRVTAPFNAVIRSRHADLGAQVGPSTPLVTLTDADVFWIVAPVPVSQLRWLEIPERAGDPASTARVYSGGNTPREGVVLRRLPGLEEGGRMAQLVIEVRDPLARLPEHRGAPPLLLGDFVRVELFGATWDDALALDRRWLRAGDQVWLMNEQDELEIRPVEVAFRGEHTAILADGLSGGERVITTDLATPVAGMKLTTGRAGGARPPQAEAPGAGNGP
ncbi:MAG TPA: efflux RND transporter periplasmic adaptor subunit [Kiritimatiellia bacterium]|nr:efflux RND transporter periplasmic adaptor subunit [Kiritimatiellia bacterium]HMP00123.1 efflux RND transporter periplasmic adaptor subunit [Kiritimatiellia bacterium]HMP96584.1 efflux RND transporter periplasmic adaptor subunit [Kiritimatiellia bacterium]